jgi:hypothetical protein
MPIQFRRDTAANWRAANPTLATGEPAFETDTQLFKIGADAAPYLNLPYTNAGNSSVVPGGRLTVSQNLPDTSGGGFSSAAVYDNAPIVYYSPCVSDQIVLWSGSAWRPYTFTSATALAVSQLLPGKVFDVFAFQNNGTVTLTATQWNSPTARATLLTRVNGILVKSGVAAHRYIGTICTREGTASGASMTADSFSQRFVYNHYNKVPTFLRAADDTVHVYSTPAWRTWAGTTTPSALQACNFVLGANTVLDYTYQTNLRLGITDAFLMSGVPYYGSIAAHTTVSPIVRTIALSAWSDSILAASNILTSGLTNYAQITATNPATNSITVTVPSGTVLNVGDPIWVIGAPSSNNMPTNNGSTSFLRMSMSCRAISNGVGLRTLHIMEYGQPNNGTITSSFNGFRLVANIMM